MRALQDLYDFVMCVLVPTVLFFAVVIGLSVIAERYACSQFEVATGIKTHYIGLQCWADVDGKRVPSDTVFGDAHQLRIQTEKGEEG